MKTLSIVGNIFLAFVINSWTQILIGPLSSSNVTLIILNKKFFFETLLSKKKLYVNKVFQPKF